LERSLELLKPGGLLAMVLPEGLFANRRWRSQRREILRQYQVEALVGLPRSVFRASRAAVKTGLLFLRKTAPSPGHQVRLAELSAIDLEAGAAELIEHWTAGRSKAEGRPWE
jgi:type I restriction enzyme M protein